MIETVGQVIRAELERQASEESELYVGEFDPASWVVDGRLDVRALTEAIVGAVGGTDWGGVDVGQMVLSGDRIRAEYGDVADTAVELTVTPPMHGWVVSKLFRGVPVRYRSLQVKPAPAPQLETNRGNRFD